MDAAAIVDVVLGVLAIEAVVLWLLGQRMRRMPPWTALLPNLAAGLFLVLALRASVHGDGVVAIGLLVALGGVAHVVDLRSRLRG